MTLKSLATCGATALALLATAGVSQAATAPSGAAPPVTYGPPITGVCVVSTSEAIGASTVGKSFSDRMNQLQQQVATELQPQETELATEQHTLQSAATPDQTREAAFNLKVSEYQKLRDERVNELKYTYSKQLQRLGLELRPVLDQVFQQKNCSILLERDSGVLGVNPAMDLTQAAILGLNAKIQTITFDREAPPPDAGAPAGSQ